MNYYGAREITKDGKPTGLYHYTVRNDNVIRPVGPCADDCRGHETKEEACEHYRQWLIEGIEFTPRESEWPKDKCEVEGCDEEAIMVGVSHNEPGQFNQRRFCAKHATRQEMAKFTFAGERISSY